MVFKDYYKILELNSTRVTKEQIKIAYRNQAKKYHPDLNTTKSDEIIKDINEAYKVLSDDYAKKKYDRLWNSYVGKNKAGNIAYKQVKHTENILDELTEIFFGNYFKTEEPEEKKIKTQVITLKLSIHEAYKGCNKTLVFAGKELEVLVPAKSKAGDIIKAANLKNKEKEEVKYLITIEIEKDETEKDYDIKGNDLIKILNISPVDAVLGIKKEIDIFGEKMSIIIERGIKNKEFKIKNKGFKSKTGEIGNLIIQINILIPNDITEEEEKLYLKLQEIEINKADV